jgi:hypothetical protein
MGNEMLSRDRQYRVCFNSSRALTLGVFLLWIWSLILPGIASATTIYSYIDDRGTPVLTDNLENIPERYRAKVKVTEQAPNGAANQSVAVKLQQRMTDFTQNTGGELAKFTSNIPGLTHYQSQVFSIGGIATAICLFARFFLRGQVIRFLSLWCLIMLGLIVPTLVFTSQDAPLDRLIGQAGKIQDKQQKHLQGTL